METISSRNNKLIIECGKLKNKKYRDRSRLFFFEGVKLLEEAVKCGVSVKYLFCTDDFSDIPHDLPSDAQIYRVADSVYEKLTEERSPQGVFCVARYIDNLHKTENISPLSDQTIDGKSYFLVESVRDPGNLGTIIRTASAMGIDTLIMSDDCADIYNSKTVRAAMGAVFRQKTIYTDDMPAVIKKLKENDIYVCAATLDEKSISINDLQIGNKKICFAVGNEGHGLSRSIIDACDRSVIIPMSGDCESLNVAAATAILMWQERIINRH